MDNHGFFGSAPANWLQQTRSACPYQPVCGDDVAAQERRRPTANQRRPIGYRRPAAVPRRGGRVTNAQDGLPSWSDASSTVRKLLGRLERQKVGCAGLRRPKPGAKCRRVLLRLARRCEANHSGGGSTSTPYGQTAGSSGCRLLRVSAIQSEAAVSRASLICSLEMAIRSVLCYGS